MKNVSYRIRKLRQKEIHILDDFLYEAIFIPEGTKAPPKEIIKEPELQVYVADFWEKKDDICYVAEISGKIAGAVWCRIMGMWMRIRLRLQFRFLRSSDNVESEQR